MAKKQDDLAQRRRLNRGACPVHGIPLKAVGFALSDEGEEVGDKVACPRGDCTFIRDVVTGTELWRAWANSENPLVRQH